DRKVGGRAPDEQAVADGEAAHARSRFPAARLRERGRRRPGARRGRGGPRRSAVEPPLGARRRGRRLPRGTLHLLGVEAVDEPDRLRSVGPGGGAATSGREGGGDRDRKPPPCPARGIGHANLSGRNRGGLYRRGRRQSVTPNRPRSAKAKAADSRKKRTSQLTPRPKTDTEPSG